MEVFIGHKKKKKNPSEGGQTHEQIFQWDFEISVGDILFLNAKGPKQPELY